MKNSVLSVKDGDLEEDYVGTVFPEKMKSSPWMLGVNGNARATNLMDKGTATYFNSELKAQKWGVLSTDDNKGVKLWAINCDVVISGGMKEESEIYKNVAKGTFDFYDDEIDHDFPEGEWQSKKKPSGYGTYSIGDTKVVLAGSQVVVPDYVAICANGPASLNLTSSDAVSIADAYEYLNIVEDIEPKKTMVFSKRFGVMYHSGAGAGVTTVEKGTVMYTGKTAFSVKGCGTVINVDNSHIYTGNNIILQVMDNDDAGINNENFETTTSYEEKHVKGVATEEESNASSIVKEGGVFATFSNMQLCGDMYNSSGWEESKEADSLAGAGDYTNEVGGGASEATDLSVVFDNVSYMGVISTTEAFHNQSVITHKDYDQIGEVNNKVCIPENAGVVVKVTNNSRWDVTGTGFVTGLIIDETSSMTAEKVFLNGKELEIEKGKFYRGVIRIEGKEKNYVQDIIAPETVKSGCLIQGK